VISQLEAVSPKGRADRKPAYHGRPSKSTHVEIFLRKVEKEKSCPVCAENRMPSSKRIQSN